MDISKRIDFRFGNLVFSFWSSLLLVLIFLVNVEFRNIMPLDLWLIASMHFFFGLVILVRIIIKYKRVYKYSDRIVLKPLIGNKEIVFSNSDISFSQSSFLGVANPLRRTITIIKTVQTFFFFPSITIV